MPHVLPSSHSSRTATRRVTPAGTFVVAGSLLLVAWGCFAFGAVYPWAYAPLVVGSVIVGLTGLGTGGRTVWAPNRVLLAALLAVAALAGLQLIPMTVPLLATVSPGTLEFLKHYDLRYSTVEPGGDATALLRPAMSIAPDRTFLFLLLFAGPFMLLVGLLRTLSRTAAVRLARGVVFIGLVLAVFAIVQKALLGDAAYSGMKIYGFWRPEFLLTTPYGPFVNKNHFAGWMLMAVPMALGLAMGQAALRSRDTPRDLRSTLVWLSEPTGGRFLLYLVCAAIMGLSLTMAGSRSGLGCFAIALCGSAAWTFRRSWRASAGALAAAVLLIVAAVQWAGRDAALHRFETDTESLKMRRDIWRTSATIIPHFMMLGTGMNTFGTAMIVYQPPAKTHYNEAHNDYVQLLVEGGVTTFALVLVAIGGVTVSVARRFRADDDGPQASWVRVGATTGLVAIALQSLVEFSLQMPGNATLCAVLLALSLYVPAPHAARKVR